ncbi:MAG: hypothetical protein RLZZ490_578 [Cyanobacteriota bacterium]
MKTRWGRGQTKEKRNSRQVFKKGDHREGMKSLILGKTYQNFNAILKKSKGTGGQNRAALGKNEQ